MIAHHHALIVAHNICELQGNKSRHRGAPVRVAARVGAIYCIRLKPEALRKGRSNPIAAVRPAQSRNAPRITARCRKQCRQARPFEFGALLSSCSLFGTGWLLHIAPGLRHISPQDRRKFHGRAAIPPFDTGP